MGRWAGVCWGWGGGVRGCLHEREREGGVGWEGGKWGRWCALEQEVEEEEEEGCSAAVERSERRLQSLLMGDIRLCHHSSEALWLIHLLILDGPALEGKYHI